ncbi:MAG: DUF4147 domain-containing protein [Sulfitobacter sp.]
MPDIDPLIALFERGVAAVHGDTCVRVALGQIEPPAPDQIIAVGKAAAAMAQAAVAHYGPAPTLIVTKYGHSDHAPAHATVIEAAHPVPDDGSLMGGRAIRDAVTQMASGSHLMMLVSGGASSLAEVPIQGMTLADMAARTSQMLASGADISAMNTARKTFSQIKGGKLLAAFPGAYVTTLAISDVQGDGLGVIGSGIGDAPALHGFEFSAHIVASNEIARAAVAKASGFPVHTNTETLYDNIETLGPALAAALISADKGLHIFGGEPTVILPENPGQGGRNQALALILAREISGVEGLRILVAGTDGTDGPTDAAGAIVDGTTWDASGADALARADARPWLDAKGALLKTGPTGTNVMDLVLALRT